LTLLVGFCFPLVDVSISLVFKRTSTVGGRRGRFNISTTVENINVEAGATPAVGRMVEAAVLGGEVDLTSARVENINVEAEATPAVGRMVEAAGVLGGEVELTSATVGNINVEARATPAVGRMVEVAVLGGEADLTEPK
jgi:hypothetical protein